MTGLKKRIAIIDSLEFCHGLSFIIDHSEKFKTIARYKSISEAIEAISDDRPDIIIFDIDQLDSSSSQLISKMHGLSPHILLLVLSANLNDELIFTSLSSGVRGYLSKKPVVVNRINFYLEELITNGSCLSADVTSKVIAHFYKSQVSPLSRRETEVLKLISTGNSYSEISSILQISKETSRTHIKNIYKKLEVGKKSEAVKKAHTEKLI
jgi:DNA-binding NarL/FixJ family response regulator